MNNDRDAYRIYRHKVCSQKPSLWLQRLILIISLNFAINLVVVATAFAQDDIGETPPVEFDADQDRYPGLQSGVWTIGIGGMYNYTYTRSELEDGGHTSDTSTFMRIEPQIGYFILPNLELSLSAGLLSRTIDETERLSSTQREWFAEIAAAYFWELATRFSLIGAIGAGAYFGTNERPLTLDENGDSRETREETDTGGLSTSIFLGAGYLAAPRIQLRAGIGLNGLFGAEKVGSLDDSLGIVTLHSGLELALIYFF